MVRTMDDMEANCLCKYDRPWGSRCESVLCGQHRLNTPRNNPVELKTVRAENLEGQNPQRGPKGLKQSSSLVLGKE